MFGSTGALTTEWLVKPSNARYVGEHGINKINLSANSTLFYCDSKQIEAIILGEGASLVLRQGLIAPYAIINMGPGSTIIECSSDEDFMYLSGEVSYFNEDDVLSPLGLHLEG